MLFYDVLCKFGLVACINCCVLQENQNEGSLTSSNQLKNKMVQRQMSLNFNSQRKTEKTSERLWWTLSCKFIRYIMRHAGQWEKYIWKADDSKYCFEEIKTIKKLLQYPAFETAIDNALQSFQKTIFIGYKKVFSCNLRVS